MNATIAARTGRSLHKAAKLHSLMKPALVLLLGLLFTAATSPAFGVAITWDNGSANQLWSDNGNWNPDNPASGNDITFNDTASAAAAGTVTNIVDASVSVNSLQYIQDNATGAGVPAAKFHTTQINSGNTLTVLGSFAVGASNFVGTTTNIRGSSAGTGTLTINNAAAFFNVDPGGNFFTPSDTVVLNMTGLGTFNATVNQFNVGRFGGGPKTLTMADNSNTVIANLIGLNEFGWNATTSMQLGHTNVLHANTLSVSGQGNPQSSTTTLSFRAGLAPNPTVQIRDTAGTGRADVLIGLRSHTSGNNTATMNLNGGAVDALIDELRIGIGATSPADTLNQVRPGVGLLQFNGGTVDATTVVLGNAGVATAMGTTSGTITVGLTGTMIADTITMTNRPLGFNSAVSATINLNDTATLRATNIFRGASVGTGAATIAFNWSGGTIGNRTGTDLTVATEVPLTLLTAANHTFDATAGQSITINSAIGGAGTGTVTKTGAGTLYLNNANTYTGTTIVNAGTLAGTGSLAGDLIVNNTGTFSPGLSPDIFNAQDGTFNAGATYYVEIGGTTPGTEHDQLVLSGAAAIDGNLVIELINGFVPDPNDTFTIIDAASLTGQFSNVIVLGIGAFDVSYINGDVILSNFTVPEPSTCLMLGLGLAGLSLVRRRRNATVRSGESC